MRMFEIDLTGRHAELVADRCWQAGAAGLWEVDAATLRAGVHDDAAETFVTALRALGPRDVTDATAVELAGRRSLVAFLDRTIELWVPPTVFGDGHHPTTASCLVLLPGLVRPGTTVLDVGCGAGALSVAAALLGGAVTAIDLDPAARAATSSNAAVNGVEVEVSPRSLEELEHRYEVVLANLSTGALLSLVPALLMRTAPGGTIVLSGMLEEQWPPVEERAGGVLWERRLVDGWVTAAVTVPG